MLWKYNISAGGKEPVRHGVQTGYMEEVPSVLNSLSPAQRVTAKVISSAKRSGPYSNVVFYDEFASYVEEYEQFLSFKEVFFNMDSDDGGDEMASYEPLYKEAVNFLNKLSPAQAHWSKMCMRDKYKGHKTLEIFYPSTSPPPP